MPSSPFVDAIRAKVGHDLIMLPSATVMLFDDQHRLLLVEDANTGYWITVGGAVDPDEPPADAAVRECWEELGLLVEPTRLIGVFGGPHFRSNYANGDTVSYVATVFEVRKVLGEPRPDGVEITKMRYVSREEAKALKMSVATREMVDYAFDFDGTPYFSKPAWRPPK
jgi:8-oxo-dGTP pyrophosphatase MutT (NUDIX family)